jgi:lysophospholipase L1-like esterase
VSEPSSPGLRYVALGDSYTVGTSVRPEERWPEQLVGALRGGPSLLELVANLGVNGYTTADLIVDELPRLEALRPGFLSLLIGVNDVVQGVPAARYEANLARILEALLRHVAPSRIVTVSIPDYTSTPRGSDYGAPVQQRAEIEAFNGIMAGMSEERGVRFVDILDLSLRAAADRTLVADDGLHPSGTQYRLWVERIAPVVDELLSRRRTT